MFRTVSIAIPTPDGNSFEYSFHPWPGIVCNAARDGYIVRDNDGFAEFCPVGPWRERFAEVLRSHNLTGLVLNRTLGFRDHDLGFLKKLGFIERLRLASFDDIEEVHALTNLRFLEVIASEKCAIDLVAFSNLESLVLDHMPKMRNLSSCTKLSYLFLIYYRQETLERLNTLANLRELRIGNCPAVSLQGIQSLLELRILQLHRFRKLEFLNAISSLSRLEHLELCGCRNVRSIDMLAALTQTRYLEISDVGEIPSLTPLRSMQELETVLFDGTTSVKDGDLSPLLELPKLNRIFFRNRKWYTHTLAQIEAAIESRSAP